MYMFSILIKSIINAKKKTHMDVTHAISPIYGTRQGNKTIKSTVCILMDLHCYREDND